MSQKNNKKKNKRKNLLINILAGFLILLSIALIFNAKIVTFTTVTAAEKEEVGAENETEGEA